MADLNLDLDYFDHPKTIRLIGLMGKRSDGEKMLASEKWIW
jgi:hypothetical protein